MKLTTIAALVATLSFNAFAANTKALKEELYVFANNEQVIKTLQSNSDLIVDHVSEHGFELYGPKGTSKYLADLGVRFIEADSNKLLTKAFADYPSFEQITTKLKKLAADYPSIIKLTSIGKSVEGRELWMVKISDNVEVDELEPEVKYISSMHGDEITGRELMQFLIEDIAKGYGSDSQITNLVDNTELYIMVSMNPDGSKKRRRWNANGTDLNRNFPEFTRGDSNSWAGKEPETQAVMKFQASRNFALSANFHGGAVVVNYPWDATHDRHPMDSLVIDISKGYADLVPEMRNSSEFRDGITNGADWYVLKGGMQDWSYHWHNDLQVTVELSGRKWPSYSKIPGYYRANKKALLYYLAKVHQGAGIAFDNPNQEGSVQIIDSQGNDLGVFGFNHGQFYKVLPQGEYKFIYATSNKQMNTVEVRVTDEIRSNGNFTQL